jgi:hypothetical protein
LLLSSVCRELCTNLPRELRGFSDLPFNTWRNALLLLLLLLLLLTFAGICAPTFHVR